MKNAGRWPGGKAWLKKDRKTRKSIWDQFAQTLQLSHTGLSTYLCIGVMMEGDECTTRASTAEPGSRSQVLHARFKCDLQTSKRCGSELGVFFVFQNLRLRYRMLLPML